METLSDSTFPVPYFISWIQCLIAALKRSFSFGLLSPQMLLSIFLMQESYHTQNGYTVPLALQLYLEELFKIPYM